MFTVIIPLYNKKSCIERAINSAVNQIHPPSEILVIDDGSTDGSGELVTNIKSKLLTYIRQDNFGVSHARNTGMRLAKGDYIAFLDADDEWDTDHLLTISNLITKYPEASVYASAYKLKYPGGHSKNANIVFDRNFTDGIINNFYEISSRGNCILSSTTTAVKRDIIDIAGGFPLGVRLREDTCFWIKLVSQFKLAATSKITATYHKKSENSACEYSIPTSADQLFLKLILENIDSGKIRGREVLFSLKFSNRYTRMNAMKSYSFGSIETAKEIMKQHKNITTTELMLYMAIIFILYAPNFMVKKIINFKRKISNEN